MGTGSKVVSVIFRLIQLISASIVAGNLGYYLHRIHDAGVGNNSRVVYAISIAGISIFFSLVLMPPLTYSFYAFPLDFALFVCWMVAFGLLDNLAGSGGCNSTWFRTSWGWAWGGWYGIDPVLWVGTPGCGNWRASLAWSFIGGFFWLFSFVLGIVVLIRLRSGEHDDSTHTKIQEKGHVANGAAPVYPDGPGNPAAAATQNQESSGGQRTFAQPQQEVSCSQCGTLGRLGTRFCNNCGFEQRATETV